MKARLFYIIGSSGAGKDSLLRLCRERLPETVLVAHRYITRPPDLGGENHVALTRHEYDVRSRNQLFAMEWTANGHRYGVGREIELWLGEGCHVLVNGSRGYLDTAIEHFGERLVPVLVQVDAEQLRQRLERRGRECQRAIAQRIERAERFEQTVPGGIEVVDNNADLEQAFDQLAAVLDRYNSEQLIRPEPLPL